MTSDQFEAMTTLASMTGVSSQAPEQEQQPIVSQEYQEGGAELQQQPIESEEQSHVVEMEPHHHVEQVEFRLSSGAKCWNYKTLIPSQSWIRPLNQ